MKTLIQRLAALLNRDPFYGFACEWKWFRRAIGGRWEYWIVDEPIGGTHWFQAKQGMLRPFCLCRCEPIHVEEYT